MQHFFLILLIRCWWQQEIKGFWCFDLTPCMKILQWGVTHFKVATCYFWAILRHRNRNRDFLNIFRANDSKGKLCSIPRLLVFKMHIFPFNILNCCASQKGQSADRHWCVISAGNKPYNLLQVNSSQLKRSVCGKRITQKLNSITVHERTGGKGRRLKGE